MAFDNVGKLTDADFDHCTMIMLAEDIAEERGIDLYGYDALAAQAAAAREADVEEVVIREVTIRTGSMKSRAIALYNTLTDKSRKAVVTALVDELGCKKVTASTYAHNLTSGKWS